MSTTSDGAPITAESLLSAARERGLPVLGFPPEAGVPCEVLLASLGLDLASPRVRRRLVELFEAGLVVLTRVDAEDEVPDENRPVWERSRFCYGGTWFDSVAWDGGHLAERSDAELVDLVRRGAGRAQPTPREWARLAVLAAERARPSVE